MCTHTYSEAHAHSTYVRMDEGTSARTDRQTSYSAFIFLQFEWPRRLDFFFFVNSAIRDEMPPYVAFIQ